MHNIGLLLFCSVVIITSTASAEETSTYKLKKGDKLSELLYQKGYKPLYGKKGFVKKAVLLNGKKIKADGNLVLAGVVIVLPKIPADTINPTIETHPNTSSAPLEIPPKIVNEEINSQPEIKTPELKEEFVFSISPSLSWYKFITDTKKTNLDYDITALSKASLGIDLHLKKKFNQNYSYYVFGKINSIKFYSDTAYLFTKSPVYLKKLGIGIEREFGSQNNLSVEVSVDDQVFLELVDVNTIRPKLMSVPVFTLFYSDVIFNVNDIGCGYGVLSKLLLPHDTSLSETGMGYGVGGEVFAKKTQFGLKIFYYYDQARALGQTNKTYDIGWSGMYEF